MFRAFVVFIVAVVILLIVIAFKQYRRTDRTEFFHFDLDQLELTAALAWGGVMTIFVGVVLHYCFMWPVLSVGYAVAMGVSFSFGMIISIARQLWP
jgi:multisubunit Na+/H+ antiporter MnhB subunit